MDKETLSHYGWIVVLILILSVLIALATPFGRFVATSVQNTTEALFDTKQKGLDAAGIELMEQEFENSFNESFNKNESETNQGGNTLITYEIIEGANQTISTKTAASFRSNADYNKFDLVKIDNNVVNPSNYTVSEGSTIIKLNGEYLATLSNGLHTLTIVSSDGSAICEFNVNITFELGTPSNPIPDGATYTISATGEILQAGDNFPETVSNKDIYTYGDYEYRYNQSYSSLNAKWMSDTTQNGWGVRVLDNTKTTYGTILESINGKPVTDMSSTFEGCTSLVTAPAIPSSVTDMSSTFRDCASLVVGPIIPESVKTMGYTFYGCSSLKNVQAIPYGVVYMKCAFGDCTSLVTVPGIPSSVTNLDSAFRGCTSLNCILSVPCGVIATSAGVKVERYHFEGCGH